MGIEAVLAIFALFLFAAFFPFFTFFAAVAHGFSPETSVNPALVVLSTF
jgi:hypothetical protein